jgi:hypothetical protein
MCPEQEASEQTPPSSSDDGPEALCRLVCSHELSTGYSCFLAEFYFQLDGFLYEVTNLNFTDCDVISWSFLLGAGKSGRLSSQRTLGPGRM